MVNEIYTIRVIDPNWVASLRNCVDIEIADSFGRKWVCAHVLQCGHVVHTGTESFVCGLNCIHRHADVPYACPFCAENRLKAAIIERFRSNRWEVARLMEIVLSDNFDKQEAAEAWFTAEQLAILRGFKEKMWGEKEGMMCEKLWDAADEKADRLAEVFGSLAVGPRDNAAAVDRLAAVVQNFKL